MWLVDSLFSRWEWHRRARGGRWQYERNMANEGWFRVELFGCERGSLCVSALKREDHRR